MPRHRLRAPRPLRARQAAPAGARTAFDLPASEPSSSLQSGILTARQRFQRTGTYRSGSSPSSLAIVFWNTYHQPAMGVENTERRTGRRPTMREVAAVAGVSLSTVSRVVNGG